MDEADVERKLSQALEDQTGTSLTTSTALAI